MLSFISHSLEHALHFLAAENRGSQNRDSGNFLRFFLQMSHGCLGKDNTIDSLHFPDHLKDKAVMRGHVTGAHCGIRRFVVLGIHLDFNTGECCFLLELGDGRLEGAHGGCHYLDFFPDAYRLFGHGIIDGDNRYIDERTDKLHSRGEC